MKVAIGFRVQSGAWGGGNRFVTALIATLERAGHAVVTSLDDDNIDLILVIDPRARNRSIPFAPGAVMRYRAYRNRAVVVVHRINECDERKRTKTMNARLVLANGCADHTVFVGSWLLDLPAWRHKDRAASSVILNGADTSIFNGGGYRPWTGAEPVKLVTHHWGGNWMKGFDVYQRLDRMLATPGWRERIDFTYVGNLPPGFRFEHARHVMPLDGDALADELRGHHVYVTASINEPGGNHQNEGALCGLPLLYRASGCLPEYCDGFGVMFNGVDDFEMALVRMIDEYSGRAGTMVDYPHTAARTTGQYLTLFENLVAHRHEMPRPIRPLSFLLNQVPW
jgi:hypothetical protein